MSIKLNVPDMSCGHCKAAIEKAMAAADPLAELTFDMEARHVEIDSDLDLAALTALLDEAGFPAVEVQGEA